MCHFTQLVLAVRQVGGIVSAGNEGMAGLGQSVQALRQPEGGEQDQQGRDGDDQGREEQTLIAYFVPDLEQFAEIQAIVKHAQLLARRRDRNLGVVDVVIDRQRACVRGWQLGFI